MRVERRALLLGLRKEAAGERLLLQVNAPPARPWAHRAAAAE
jgi:hypothetical protein